MTSVTPPLAAARPHPITQHGQSRVDDYFWLRDRTDPAVLEYLNAENQFAAAQMAGTQALQERLLAEMRGRIQEEDETVPERHGEHLYFARTEAGQEYAAIYRRPVNDPTAAPQLLIDLNEQARGRSFCRLGGWRVSDDERFFAYLIDFAGDEAYSMIILDLRSGLPIADRIDGVYYGFEWAADNRTLFYTVLDEAHRPYRTYRHTLDTDTAEDVLVHDEADPMFFVYVRRTRSSEYLFITSYSGTTGEVRVIPADRPALEPVVVVPRRPGVEVALEHQGDRFLLLTNDSATNFRVLTAPIDLAAPIDSAAAPQWQELIPTSPDVLIESVDGFRDVVVVQQRCRGLRDIAVYDAKTWTHTLVPFPDAAYSVQVEENPEYDTDRIRVVYSSLARPEMVADVHWRTGEWTVLKTDRFPRGHNVDDYVVERLEAIATDGKRVPISVIYRRGALKPGGLPTLITGYGAYGSNIEPGMAKNWLSLVDRGMLCAIAHVRGGSDLGRSWYEDGRMRHKRNTFTDFIACAEHLIAAGYADRTNLAALGVSAGGLLMGAVLTLRPDLWRTVVAKVPFVDVINTMSDGTIPLTAIEWEQWGNPLNDPDDFAYMLSYSPYENLRETEYPNLLLTAGFNDPRVQYWEPAKFCAKLRVIKTDTNRLLLKTNMDAGHAGASGRFDKLREIAFEWAFILDTLGLSDSEPASSTDAD